MAPMTKAQLLARAERLQKSLRRETAKRKDLERAQKESVEQQTATSEILRVISTSPTQLRPVLDAIAERAARLCEAWNGTIVLSDGEALGMEAHYGPLREQIGIKLPIDRGSISGRAFVEGRTVHVDDLSAAGDFPLGSEYARRWGVRTALATPLVREGVSIGVILIRRTEIHPFSDRHIALLQTFADQAVIAIENVRLFNETKEALEQQTATSEILQVISSSPTDVQPTFEAIAASARRLCEAAHGMVFRFDGELIHLAAHDNLGPDRLAAIRSVFPIPPGRGSVTARAILTRALVHVRDRREDPELEYSVLSANFPNTLSVPLLRDGVPLGAITVTRAEIGLFSARQIALLQTFADQAVIAIENVRLFTELQEKNRALTDAHSQITEALERQTATSEILSVISSSPTDVQPVFDTIVRSAMRLLGGFSATLRRLSGDQLDLVAFSTTSESGDEALKSLSQLPLAHDPMYAQVVRDRVPHFTSDTETDPRVGSRRRELARARGYRSALNVPMLCGGDVIGAIAVTRREPGPFTDDQIGLLQTFADQAVIAIENVRLFTELQEKNRALTDAHAQVSEALEQKTATAEILRVISSSPTDVQPVFDTIVRSAVRLCDGLFSALFQFDGELIHHVAHHNFTPEALEEMHRIFPTRPTRALLPGRAILERAVVHIPDVLELDPEFRVQAVARTLGFRSGLWVPMLREGAPIGVIVVTRAEPGPFSDNEIELLKTFADQAVIAIENVRLFNELEARNTALTEALDQQTATAEILRVISSSPTDMQPVFDAIAESAARLCDSIDANILRVDGDTLHVAASFGAIPGLVAGELLRLNRDHVSGCAILDRQTVHIHDLHAETSPFPESSALARRFGHRTMLAAPLLREDAALGVIVIRRAEVRPFTDKQIELLKTFADQAVIAIENVRLFTELEARNRDLTATSEILQVISRSPTDVQPVFDTIAERAMRLCDAAIGAVFMFDGALIHLSALANVSPEGVAAIRQAFPLAPSRGSMSGRVILTGDVVQIPDVLDDPEYQLTGPAQAAKYRCNLGVPMLHQGRAIGVIVVTRPEPGTFSEGQIQLLKTFADQAVIAIENVRLFKELEAKTAELTQSVGEMKALGEVGQAVSSTLDLQTVLDTIVTRAAQLSGTYGGVIYEYDEAAQTFHLRAAHRLEDELVEALRREPLRLGEGATGQAVATRAPFQVTNLLDEKEYTLTRVRSILAELGYRSILAVPLIFEERILGALVVHRQETGAFAPAVVNLLETFAAQSALAIQNARLFQEIEDKGRQLAAASRHKSEFLANMSHELRTPLNAITGFSEVLLERMFGEINPKQTEYLQDILSSGRHLLSLINDILDLSKIEAGRMELTAASFHLPLALDNAITLVKERAARHGIALDIDVDPRLGEFVGDERKIKQVLLNLLSNAVKFTPEGGRIGVKAGLADGAVEIAVSDTGIGIAPKDQEAIFEEFRQVGSDEARKVEGTGLGLTLTKKFVEMHGGRIWVESDVGKGSTFRFTLPVRPWPTSSS